MTSGNAYNFTDEMRTCCAEIVELQALQHVRLNQCLFGISQARKNTKHGLYAACYPLRFESGSRFTTHRGTRWEWPVIRVDGHEILYYIAFYLPRFLELKTPAKLQTIVHELFHISPYFDGDLRRLGEGRYAHHGPSRAFYDRLIEPIVDDATTLELTARYDFMRMRTAALRKKYGKIVGQTTRKLRPIRAYD